MARVLRDETAGVRRQRLQVSLPCLLVLFCYVLLGEAVFVAWYATQVARDLDAARADSFRRFAQQIRHARSMPQETLDQWADAYEVTARQMALRVYGDDDGQ